MRNVYDQRCIDAVVELVVYNRAVKRVTIIVQIPRLAHFVAKQFTLFTRKLYYNIQIF